MYGATHSRGAYVETLAALNPADLDYAELFDDVAPGQYIDVMAGDTISTLRRHFTE